MVRIASQSKEESLKRYLIVDCTDTVIGVKPRNAISPEDIYRVSALWVTNSKGGILLCRRSLSKEHDPGKFGSAVAGTVEEGEEYYSNIIKEAKEEIGLTEVPFRKGPHLFVSNGH